MSHISEALSTVIQRKELLATSINSLDTSLQSRFKQQKMQEKKKAIRHFEKSDVRDIFRQLKLIK